MKKKTLFSKIETKEDAINIIKKFSISYIVISIILALIPFIVLVFIESQNINTDIIVMLFINSAVNSIIIIILAIMLRVLKSRIVAILLLLLSIYSLIVTGINKFTGSGEGGTNIIIAIILVLISIKLVEASVKYNKLK